MGGDSTEQGASGMTNHDNAQNRRDGAASDGLQIKVAVVGAGVAGLGAAWHLSTCENVDVTILEADNRAGGHANTVDVKMEDGSAVPVDTGFMVFNEDNYPNLVGLFRELDVQGEDTDMSFSVSLDNGKFEWGSKGLSSLFARKRNLFHPSFYGMLQEMAKFNREAPLLLLLDDDDPRKAVSVREYLQTNGFSESFACYYLVPMAAALWSSTAADVMGHSALAMISFFHNHQMLQVFSRPQWMTPAGRSCQYVREICRRIGEDRIELGNACVRVATATLPRPKEVATSSTVRSSSTGALAPTVSSSSTVASAIAVPISTVKNALFSTVKSDDKPVEDATVDNNDGVAVQGEGRVSETRAGERKWMVTDSNGVTRVFDQVIFACPADTALALLGEEASSDEKDALSRFEFSENVIYIHSDEKLMPVRRAAWSAWNYIGTSTEISAAAVSGYRAKTKPVFVTYWLNKLQNLTSPKQLFVSLNPNPLPEESAVHKKMQYRHPQFSPSAEKGQRLVSNIDGKRGLWFCGAWRGYGFHEDGLRSGLHAATGITGKPVPWVDPGDVSSSPGDVSSSPPVVNSISAVSKPSITPAPSTDTLALSDAARGGGAQQGLFSPQPRVVVAGQQLGRRLKGWTNGLVEAIAMRAIVWFLRRTVVKGCMAIECPDRKTLVFGDPNTIGVSDGDGTSADGGRRINLKVFDWWFFVRVAMEYDLGLARSYLAGEWELIGDNVEHDGLRHLFLFFVDNRDVSKDGKKGGMKAGKLLTSWVGYGLNYLRYKLSMDNSISGSRSNIAAHYDLSNELFKLFLDEKYMLYSCGVFDAQMGRAAETVGCRVHGITLSKEQKALAEEKVMERGLQTLVTFELVDYRVFAEQHAGEFDRIISCEMIEAVGHNYLGTFFASCDALLAPGGIMVMQAITTPENRYEEYIKSTDFINTIIFPGSCCPSLNALLEAMAKYSGLSLEGLDNICVHYARTLKEWRHRFNHSLEHVTEQGFDSAFVRCFNYYFAYCEAGFASRTEGCLMLTFARPGTAALDRNAVKSMITR